MPTKSQLTTLTRGAFLLVAFTVAGSPVVAQDRGVADPAYTAMDRQILDMLAARYAAEIDLANLALERKVSGDVAKFAERLATDDHVIVGNLRELQRSIPLVSRNAVEVRASKVVVDDRESQPSTIRSKQIRADRNESNTGVGAAAGGGTSVAPGGGQAPANAPRASSIGEYGSTSAKGATGAGAVGGSTASAAAAGRVTTVTAPPPVSVSTVRERVVTTETAASAALSPTPVPAAETLDAASFEAKVTRHQLAAARKRLQEFRGRDFDRAYVAMAVEQHQHLLSLQQVLRTYASPDFRPVIDRGIESTLAHLDEADALWGDLLLENR